MRKFYLNFMGMIVLLSVVLNSCAISREQEVEDELSGFRAWIDKQANNTADRTEEDWQRAKQEFKNWTTELDKQQEHFSGELKQDYELLKNEFRSLDESYERSRYEAKVAAWERNLLGEHADFATITRQNIQEVYVSFIENVRRQYETWSDDDWKMAKLVLQKLNERKSVVAQDLPTDDEVKIKALQLEFSALETAEEVSGEQPIG